jgi:single-strand DNA-binding protein
MAELNKVLMIGRLTKDPELRYTPGGLPVADFRLAANHTYRTKEGEKREEVCFIDVNVMGRGAEIAKEYLAKGREVFVEGRLQLSTWENQEGEKRSRYRVIADRFQFLGARAGGGGERSGPEPVDPESGGGGGGGGSFDASSPPAEDDDLPF